jgi:hypothetical protein
MTVQELIKELKTLDPYAEVRIQEDKPCGCGYVYDFYGVEEMEATSTEESEVFLLFKI